MKNRNILVFVGQLKSINIDDIEKFKKDLGQEFRIMLILDFKKQPTEIEKKCDFIIRVDFADYRKIAQALLPYQDEFLAITASGESNVPQFSKIIPNVPYLKTPTTESLLWATDKYDMRRRLKTYCPQNTPKFTLVNDSSKKEINRLIERIGFPIVVKPANLSASSFVTVSYHEEELEKNLKKIFRGVKSAYKKANRNENPKIIAEEYMDGIMYSIDSYVDGKGEIFHCPLVRVKTGKDIGHDDFYNYIRITPTNLNQESVMKAQQAAENAVHALGLRYSTAHIELMRVDNDWKIIELGARRGGFREVMYQLSCDINHTMNDVLVRIPKKVIIPKKCKGYCALIQKFADKEGYIIEMKGVKKIEELESFHSININKKIGDRAAFARNGGKSIFNVFLYNPERAKLLADIRRIEDMVKVKVVRRLKVVENNGSELKKAVVKNGSSKMSAQKASNGKTVKSESVKGEVKKMTTKKVVKK